MAKRFLILSDTLPEGRYRYMILDTWYRKMLFWIVKRLATDVEIKMVIGK